MILEYHMVRNGVRPSRANPSDAGLDLYWNPTPPVTSVCIGTGDSVILETGCQFAIPHGYCLKVENRSSVASKKKLVIGATIIDPGYSNEVFINLINVGKEEQSLSIGDKIAQVVMYPIIHFRLNENQDLFEDLPVVTNRGNGGFGSTGE